MKPNTLIGLATACSLLFTSSQIWAHSPAESEPGGLGALVRESAAIAYGKVVDIQYRNSEPTREEPKGVPHTFVTYAVEKVLRGNLPEKFTLRIPGGANGSGGVYSETDAPTFTRGETDVLFIPGGEPGECQLVNCVEGRFRVFDNRIYSGFGVPLVGAEKELEFGGKPHFELNTMELPRPSFDNLIKLPEIARAIEARKIDAAGLETLRKKYDVEAPLFYHIDMKVKEESKADDYTGEAPAGIMKKYPEPMLIDEFFTLIERLNVELGQPEQKFVMASPRAAFTVKPPQMGRLIEAVVPAVYPSLEERKFRSLPEDSVRATETTVPSTSTTAK